MLPHTVIQQPIDLERLIFLLVDLSSQVIAFFPSLTLRLIGISMASFSSGLGELTYLQLSTRYENWNGEGVG